MSDNSSFQSMMSRMVDYLDQIDQQEKQASDGNYRGEAADPGTSMPANGSDNGTHKPTTGFLYGEYEEANVQGPAFNYNSDSQDRLAWNKGTSVSATGEDPSVEKGYQSSISDPGTSVPAEAGKEKYGSLQQKYAELQNMGASLLGTAPAQGNPAAAQPQKFVPATEQEKQAFVYSLLKEAAFEAELIAPYIQYAVNTDRDIITFCKQANLVTEEELADIPEDLGGGAPSGEEELPPEAMMGGEGDVQLGPEEIAALQELIANAPPEALLELAGGGDMGGDEAMMEEELVGDLGGGEEAMLAGGEGGDPDEISEDEAIAALDAEMSAQGIAPEKLAAYGPQYVKLANAVIQHRAHSPKMAKAQDACRKFLREVIR